MGTLADEWERHAAQLAAKGVPPNQIRACRHAWYAGVVFMIDTLREQAKKGSDADLSELLRAINREATIYTMEAVLKARLGER